MYAVTLRTRVNSSAPDNDGPLRDAYRLIACLPMQHRLSAVPRDTVNHPIYPECDVRATALAIDASPQHIPRRSVTPIAVT